MLIRDVQNAIQARMVVANAVAGVVVTTYLLMVGPAPVDQSWASVIAWTFAGFFGALAVLVLIATRVARRMVNRNARWIEEGRDPTPEERRLVLTAPLTFAVYPLPFWFVAAIGTAATATSRSAPERIGMFITVILGGALTSALGYALVERGLRDVTTRALAGAAPEDPGQLTLRSRHLLAWTLGSGIPLLGIALTPFARSSESAVPLAVPMVLLAAAGLVAGFLVTVAAASAIARPMTALRDSLQWVQRGELHSSLAVDAGGEVGMVQAGFNEMVAGLREREQLRDLFGRHVGEDVARAALQQGVSLGGESREVSVFFVDLIGSSALARETSADRVVALLNRFFAAVVHAADGEGGWVNKFEGDAALCVFGAPNEQSDHAARALRAARSLRDSLNSIEAGIGVSSGRVVAGNVGSEARYEYTVIGHPVNEAARITDESKRYAGRLLASAASIAAAPDEAQHWRSCGSVELRGTGPTEVFEPI